MPQGTKRGNAFTYAVAAHGPKGDCVLNSFLKKIISQEVAILGPRQVGNLDAISEYLKSWGVFITPRRLATPTWRGPPHGVPSTLRPGSTLGPTFRMLPKSSAQLISLDSVGVHPWDLDFSDTAQNSCFSVVFEAQRGRSHVDLKGERLGMTPRGTLSWSVTLGFRGASVFVMQWLGGMFSI